MEGHPNRHAIAMPYRMLPIFRAPYVVSVAATGWISAGGNARVGPGDYFLEHEM